MWISGKQCNNNVTLESMHLSIITHNLFFAKIPSENEFLKEKTVLWTYGLAILLVFLVQW